ncbi:tail fiber protein [Turicimonas muris]|uniref:tail fiber protein n=1 Tax=Turicimonas muris TaxID=1796652 RepID=UPI0024941391|nr:tail fiber protein [Turicimonas muris]
MSTMTTINDFLPFAENADLVPFSEWQQAASRLSGFVGLAAPGELNRAIAQGANAGYAIAKFIERTLKEDVYVSNPDRLVDQLYRAMLEMSYRATPIGCILTFPVQVEIEGFVVSNFGGDLSRIDYDKLFAVYGTKFNVSSTPETKFGIPNLAYNFLEAAGQLAEIGCFVKAGLPNKVLTREALNVMFMSPAKSCKGAGPV